MNITQYQFDGDIEVINLGDVHRGDYNCDTNLLNRAIDYIKKKKNCYWISTGDIANVGLSSSVSGSYGSETLNRELQLIANDFEPIADKCLGFVKSNHHNRLDKVAGMSLDEIIADKCNIPFLGAFGIVNLTCGKLSYYMVMHHGVGGGRMRGGKVNNLVRLGEIYPCADLYMEGHTHNYSAIPEGYKYIDRKRNRISEGKSWFICTGHCLKYDRSYGADHKYKPAAPGFAHVKLKGSKVGKQIFKKITSDLFF
jgi:hypothetical protein